MPVRIIEKGTKKVTQGKFAAVKGSQVSLFTGVMADKKGGFRGCGKKYVFPLEAVTIEADNREQEVKEG